MGCLARRFMISTAGSPLSANYPKTIVIGRSLYEVRSALEEEALRRTVVNHTAFLAPPISIEDTQPPDPTQERER